MRTERGNSVFVERIKMILRKNNYPARVIQRICDGYPNGRLNTLDPQKEREETIFRSLTYVEGLSNRLEKMFKNELENTTIAHRVKKKVADLFSKTKDKLTYANKSNLVYQIPCNVCDKVYIGETERLLGIRAHEHSNCMAKPPDSNKIGEKSTALSNHYNDTGHIFGVDDIKILANERNNRKRKVLEALYITTTSTTCNFKSDVDKIGMSYAAVLSAMARRKHTHTATNEHRE